MTTDMAAFATKKDLALMKNSLLRSLASKKELSSINKQLALTNKDLASTNKGMGGLRQDLSITNRNLGSLRQDLAQTDKRLDDFHNEFLDFKDESIKRFNRLDEHIYGLGTRMDDMKEELKLHFDVAVEIIRHDLRSANKEEILNIKDRVTRLEVHTGIRAA